MRFSCGTYWDKPTTRLQRILKERTPGPLVIDACQKIMGRGKGGRRNATD